MPVPHRILIVEDDISIRGLLWDILASEGYEVRGAENGAVGLTMALTWRPDLVILDLFMPVLDGFGFMRGLRVNDTRIRVIAMTATYRQDDARVKGLGIYVINKPFDMQELQHAIRTHLDPMPPGAA